MKRLICLILPLALIACAKSPEPTPMANPEPAPPAPAATPSATSAPAADSTAQLAGHHWQLQQATTASGQRIDALFVREDAPITLDFADGRLGISNTCNRMSGAYALEGTVLRVSRLAATMMACADAKLMALDQEVGKRLEGNSGFALEQAATPVLKLTTAAGDVLTFAGQATAETRYGGPGTRLFLEVAADTKPCSHPLIPNKQCLQVREIKYDAAGIKQGSGEWQNFYEEIEGYTHEKGVRNVLRVNRYERKPVPADASSNVYVLDMVVESETVKPGN
jgi:heat shock protein HslJ